jgi:hypothetical protein
MCRQAATPALQHENHRLRLWPWHRIANIRAVLMHRCTHAPPQWRTSGLTTTTVCKPVNQAECGLKMSPTVLRYFQMTVLFFRTQTQQGTCAAAIECATVARRTQC